jgi:hypothetical protein
MKFCLLFSKAAGLHSQRLQLLLRRELHRRTHQVAGRVCGACLQRCIIVSSRRGLLLWLRRRLERNTGLGKLTFQLPHLRVTVVAPSHLAQAYR